MSEITDQQWQLIRHVFGDMAYEEMPELQGRMLKYAREAILKSYSSGHISGRDAADLLGLRNSAHLLVALGDAGLPMPQSSPEVVKEQASTFARLFRENKEDRKAAALEILNRAPDGPPDSGDEPSE